jgi:hypothetical protein
VPDGIYRALLVGNSDFPEDPHNLQALKGPVNDLALLHQALTDPERGLFEPPHVRLLPERTKRDVTTAMERFFRTASNDDTLLLYYSGHGKSDEYDSVFLCVRDTQTDLLTSTGISDVEIDGFMRSSSARAVVIILDCCYSGAFKGVAIPKALKGAGRFLITSSRRNEPSADAPDESETSAFTKHLVEALRKGVDHNHDGYVSVSDVYEHVLDTLRAETKQTPQRHFDRGAVGDVALARAPSSVAALDPGAGSGGPPILAVSPESIELRGIGPEEDLGVEIVDVFNKGGGALEWAPRATVDWIDVERFEGYCELTLRPRPGINRGSVHIRDAGQGGSRTVRVLVEVRQTHAEPRLQVSPNELDFGLLSLGGSCPPRTLLIRNLGDGSLRPHVSTGAPWLCAHQADDVVTVQIDTTESGALTGEIVVRSQGGVEVVPVRATVEERGVISVKPLLVDFGRVTAGSTPTERVWVTNRGSGTLDWEYGVTGDFFTVARDDTGLIITLAGQQGVQIGSIWIRGDGGEATVDVRAEVAQEPEPPELADFAAEPQPINTQATDPHTTQPLTEEPLSTAFTRRRNRVLVLLLVVLLALAGVGGSAAWLASRGSSPVPDAGFALALDSNTFKEGNFKNVEFMADEVWVVSDQSSLTRVAGGALHTIPVGERVATMTTAEDKFWLVLQTHSGGGGTLVSLDRNGKQTRRVELPGIPGNRRPAVSDGIAWVPTESGLYRVPRDPSQRPYRVGPRLSNIYLLIAKGSVYESGEIDARHGMVARINPGLCDASHCSQVETRAFTDPGELAATESRLWVATENSPDTRLTPLDPTSLARKGNVVQLNRGPAKRLAFEQGALWVAIDTSPPSHTESIVPLQPDTGKELPTRMDEIDWTGGALPPKLEFSHGRFWTLYTQGNGQTGVGAIVVQRTS